MKYYIQRQLNEYGPYTLADLQRYVAQGNILRTDLTRSEGMTDWVPVSQVLGNIPVPVPTPAMPPQGVPPYGGSQMYGMPGAGYGGTGIAYGAPPAASFANAPVPPDFHWALVLVIGIFTCGLFFWGWAFVEAVYVRKIKPASKGLVLVIISCVVFFTGGFINGYLRITNPGEPAYWGGPFTLISWILWIVAAFQMSDDLEEYYNSVEPIHLRLNGVMTFFFALFYFQHHFSRIAQWKRTGMLQPQQ